MCPRPCFRARTGSGTCHRPALPASFALCPTSGNWQNLSCKTLSSGDVVSGRDALQLRIWAVKHALTKATNSAQLESSSAADGALLLALRPALHERRAMTPAPIRLPSSLGEGALVRLVPIIEQLAPAQVGQSSRLNCSQHQVLRDS